MTTIPPIPDPNPIPIPPAPPNKKEEKKDWVKITGIVIAAIGGVVFALGFFCARGTFPKEMIGGKIGVASTFGIALCIASVGGAIFFYRWVRSKEESTQTA